MTTSIADPTRSRMDLVAHAPDQAASWILHRRHEELGQNFRLSWDLYIKFYAVFLTFCVAGLGWLLTTDSSGLQIEARRLIASVFMIQTVLTGMTSVAMSRYSVRVADGQNAIETVLLRGGEDGWLASVPHTAVPTRLAQWAGWANAVAMLVMCSLWLHVGFAHR